MASQKYFKNSWIVSTNQRNEVLHRRNQYYGEFTDDDDREYKERIRV